MPRHSRGLPRDSRSRSRSNSDSGETTNLRGRRKERRQARSENRKRSTRRSSSRRTVSSGRHERIHKRHKGRRRSRSGRESGVGSVISDVTASQIGEAIAQGMSKAVGIASGKSSSLAGVSTITNNIIMEFNPINNDVEDWLNSIDEYAVIYNWDECTTSHLALSKLRGPAETWYRGLPTKIFSWKEWKDMLVENFKPVRDLNKCLKEMMACVPKAESTLYEYLYEKLALIHKLKYVFQRKTK